MGSGLGITLVFFVVCQGAAVREYLGSSRVDGYHILQAEGAFDINTVMVGILVPTAIGPMLDAHAGAAERRLMK